MANVFRIHPSIGIARVGNLDATGPGDFFIGPESPGHAPVPPGGYKRAGLVKRQGARFRIYEHAPDPQTGEMIPIREITPGDARIEWTVRLGNRKGFGHVFPPESSGPTPLRNASITDPGERRRLLILEAEGQIASTEGEGARRSMDAFFLDRQGARPESHRVHLGDLLLDEAGRLVVLGGLGKSFSPAARPLHSLFNNDEWCDDTSDGIITARVTLNASGETLDAEFPAHLLIGPPDFAPAIENVISLYDLAEDIATRLPPERGPIPGAEAGVSFARHIFPVLQRVARMHWVTRTADTAHAPGRRGDFLRADLLALLRNPDPDPASLAFRARSKVVERLRVPEGTAAPDDLSFENRDMPRLRAEEDTGRELTLTRLQYERMLLWRRGQFNPDTGLALDTPAPAFDQITGLREQVEALDQAGLDSCVGGSFFPGIEGSRRLRDPNAWAAPFRLGTGDPGEITEQMSLPWQTDFLACSDAWWPAQRPNQVRVRNPAPPPAPPLVRTEWDRGAGGREAFTAGNWARMGFIVPDGAAFIEEERDEGMEPLGPEGVGLESFAVPEAQAVVDILLPEPPLNDPALVPGD